MPGNVDRCPVESSGGETSIDIAHPVPRLPQAHTAPRLPQAHTVPRLPQAHMVPVKNA